MMTHYYCSIASNAYKYKILALYNSLVRYDKDFEFFIICMSDEAEQAFSALKLEKARLIPVSEIEAAYPELLEARSTRNDKEYAWTLKPSVFLYILKAYSYTDHILWLDGDTMFLSDPAPIYSEWGSYSILLTEEGYTGKYEYMSRMYGVYNTGLIGFKRDENAILCLEWFRARVNEWCYDRMENGLWSDQMYVNDWPQRFNGVKVIKHPGINMTPFILWRYTQNGKSPVKVRNGEIYVRNKRLILFHYYGLRYDSRIDYDLCTYKDWGFSEEIVRAIYYLYLDACDTALQMFNSDNAKVEQKVSMDQPQCCCFCTIATLEYLPKCLALLASIEKHTDSFHMWICCMDQVTYDVLSRMQLLNVTSLKLSDIETDDLKSVRGSRREYEYCWTLKAPLLLYIFKNYKDVESLLYVDSDVFLFADPRICFELLKKYPVLLTCHNFTRNLKYLYSQKGRYNAGIVGFKRCSTAVSYLKWWKRKCLEWCYDIVTYGRFADQKYLEEFASAESGAYIAESTGMNAAVWNIRHEAVNLRNGKVFIGSSPLVFFHFSSFVILGEQEFDIWKWNRLELTELARSLIYMPYAEAVAGAIRKLKPYLADISEVFAGSEARYRASNYISIDYSQ